MTVEEAAKKGTTSLAPPVYCRHLVSIQMLGEFIFVHKYLYYFCT